MPWSKYFYANVLLIRSIISPFFTSQYPKSVCNGKFTISDVRDLTTGYDSSQPDKKAILPVSASSQMITFSFSNGCVLTLRTSGTEPKIKYYSEMCAKPEQQWVLNLDKYILILKFRYTSSVQICLFTYSIGYEIFHLFYA